MKTYTGDQLKNYISKRMDILQKKGVSKSRFCKYDLEQYFKTEDNKICGLYGLRRTGKTTLIYQTIQDLGYENTVYINCSNADSFIDLENELDSLDKKYVFVDEITKLEDFINLSSSLAENYPDKKIVITGTDSASLLFTKGTELYDRIILIHTTYIPFAEYKYLLNKSLEDYVQYGGTLTDGETIYNSGEDLEEYTNTSIVSNICKSVSFGKDNTDYKRLYSLYQSGSLESAINKTLEVRAREFSLKVMTGVYNKSHTLGSAKDLVLRHREEIDKDDVNTISKWKNYDEICEYITKRINLGKSDDIKEKDKELITNFLIKLDVLGKTSDGEIYFMQPGMQYCFSEVLMDEIVNTSEYQSLYPNTQDIIMNKIHEDAVGYILENVIRTDVTRCPKFSKMEIGKLNNLGNGEFDLYIVNPETHAANVYEIKRSSDVNAYQYQHLINEEFCRDFEVAHKCRIVNKTVVYQGETVELENGIRYQNVEEMLSDLDKVYDEISKDFDRSLFERD